MFSHKEVPFRGHVRWYRSPSMGRIYQELPFWRCEQTFSSQTSKTNNFLL